MAKPLTEAPERQVGKDQLAGLVRGKLAAKAAAVKAREHIDDKIANAVENTNLHRAAFNLIVSLAQKDELKRKDFLTAFDLYRDLAGEAGLFGEEHAGDLMDGAGAGEGDDPRPAFLKQQEDERKAAEDEQRETNVTRLKRGIKPLAEASA